MNANLEQLAQVAYERGRFRYALKLVPWLAPVFGLLAWSCPKPLLCMSWGCILLSVVVFLRWRGQAWERAVVPGLLAGALCCGVPLATQGCCAVYAWSIPSTTILLSVLIAGLLASLFLLLEWRWSSTLWTKPSLFLASVLAAMTGAMSCFALGWFSVLALFLTIPTLTMLATLFLRSELRVPGSG